MHFLIYEFCLTDTHDSNDNRFTVKTIFIPLNNFHLVTHNEKLVSSSFIQDDYLAVLIAVHVMTTLLLLGRYHLIEY